MLRHYQLGTSPGVGMKIVMIEGDGIGPEVMASMNAVLDAAKVKIDWVKADAGIPAMEKYGHPLPPETLNLIREHRVAVKGPCTTPVAKGIRSINVQLRKDLELFASVRPVRTMAGVKSVFSN